MVTCKIFKLLLLLFLIEIATSRTVTHYGTKLDSDGNKITRAYTATGNGDALHTKSPLIESGGASSEVYQTFNRNGATIRIKPQTEIIRIGGTGTSRKELIKQAGLIKGMDPTAVRVLLDTRQPVTRNTSDENGQKRTTTYKLEPDGSISIRSVQYRNLIASNNKANAHPLASDTEWTSLSESTANTRLNRPSTKWRTNTNNPAKSWPNKPKEETTTARLIERWKSNKRHPTKTFTSKNLPTKIFDYHSGDDDLKFNPFDSTNVNVSPVTKTTIDDNGTKVTSINSVKLTNNKNNKHPIDEDFVHYIPSKLEPTIRKSLEKTVHTNTFPTSADLDPNMLSILRKAGINPDGITSINGNTIKKTQVEPDGRVITTTYQVRIVPPPAVGAAIDASDSGNSFGSGANRQSSSFNELADPDDATGSTNCIPTRSTFHAAPTPTPTHFSSSHTYSKFPPTFRYPESIPHHSRRRSVINDFLVKIGLSVNDILNQNGELIKTIVDDDGRILTATFLLSSVRRIPNEDGLR